MTPGTKTVRRRSLRVDHSSRNARRYSQKRAGFSLLEVLVVLIVLLIGILAVLRLFPGGFLTIQRTGEQTLAVQLSAQELEALRSALGLPANIVPGLPDTNGNIHEISSITPDDLSTETDASILGYANGFTLLLGYPGYFFSDINRIRYIKGDPYHIPIANPNVVDPNNVPYGSLLPLQFGPVFNLFVLVPPGSYTDSLHVYGAALNRTIQSSIATQNLPDPRPNLTSDTVYAIDYNNSQIAFFPRLANPKYATAYRDFQITFDYYDQTSFPPVAKTQTGVIRVPDLSPANYNNGTIPVPTWQPIFDPTLNPAPANAVIRQEGEEVSRLFRLITTDNQGNTPVLTFQGGNAPQWSDDPYEYAWYTPQASGVNGNPGVLVFNPHGHVSFLSNSAITNMQSIASAQAFTNVQALTARIDYLIFDNHIIRDLRTVPSSAPYTVKLSLPSVMTNGDLLDDGSLYTGLYYGATSGTNDDIIILNANTGAVISEISAGSVPNGEVPFTLDSVTGTITFSPKTLTLNGIEDLNLQGAPLRILYRTQKNWGQQVQKASATYAPAATVNALTYKTYWIGDGTGGSLPTRIYFSLSEAGKTVSIGSYYALKAGAVNYTPYKNESFKIQDNPANFDAVNLPYIDIADADHHLADNLTGFTAAPTGRAVNDLRGLSLKSRVIWKSSGRFRRIDQDSVLPTDRL